MRVIKLAPGTVLTTRDVDDANNPKVAMLLAGMDRVTETDGDIDTILTGLRVMAANHTAASDSPVDAACIHGEVYGTVSASTVVTGNSALVYEHAPGRPCVTPFEPVPIAG